MRVAAKGWLGQAYVHPKAKIDRRSGVKPTNAGVAVKPAVERENRVGPLVFHDGEMDGVPSR